MSGKEELAGRLRERVAILRAASGRDALGAATGGWTETGRTWAALAPAGGGRVAEGDARSALTVWTIEMRDRDLAVGDRLAWRDAMLIVRAVTRDPARPDRLRATGEEQR